MLALSDALAIVKKHTAAIGRPAALVLRDPIRHVACTIAEINIADGTVDVDLDEGGTIPHVPKRLPETKALPQTWQWIGADEPPDYKPPEPPTKRTA